MYLFTSLFLLVTVSSFHVTYGGTFECLSSGVSALICLIFYMLTIPSPPPPSRWVSAQLLMQSSISGEGIASAAWAQRGGKLAIHVNVNWSGDRGK